MKDDGLLGGRWPGPPAACHFKQYGIILTYNIIWPFDILLVGGQLGKVNTQLQFLHNVNASN